MQRRARSALLPSVALLLAAAACDDTTTEPPIEEPAYDSLTVDASADWVFVDFETGTTVTPTDPTTSAAWDIGFFGTSAMLNGGAAGPGELVGGCLCVNGALGGAAIMALDPEDERDTFLAVDAAMVPAEDAEIWTSDALDPAITGWYSYNPTTHVVSPAPANVWYVRTASGTAYAKFHVVGVDEPGRSHAGTVTLEFAVQPSAGAPFGDTRTLAVDLASGAKYVDLETASVVAADADGWDLRLEGWDIRVNGGVSGDGAAGAVKTGESFAEVADASNAPPSVYAADGFGGVFSDEPWYRYNLDGQHQIWPTYDVYLVDVGAEVYKVQIIGYYGADGTSRQVTFRYAPVE